MRDATTVHHSIGMRLGLDPRLRPYDADTVATVAQRTLITILDVAKERGLAGPDEIGDVDVAAIAERLADDDVLATIPPIVAAAIVPIIIEIGAEEIAR